MNQIDPNQLNAANVSQTLNQNTDETVLSLALHLLALRGIDETPLLRCLLHLHHPRIAALGLDPDGVVFVKAAGVHERLDDVRFLAGLEEAAVEDFAVHI